MYEELVELNPRWAEFVAFYLTNGRNGAKAARDAGYAESGAHVQAHRLLRIAKVSEVLDAYWREVAMSSDEILSILSDQARGTMAPFLELDESTGLVDVNLTSEDARANLHLIKKLKSRSRVMQSQSDSDYVVVDQTIEFELHDAKDAAKVLAKHKGLLTDKLQIEEGLALLQQEFDRYSTPVKEAIETTRERVEVGLVSPLTHRLHQNLLQLLR